MITHWEMCLHESGHAIAARALGHRVTSVVARPDGGVASFDGPDRTDEAFIAAAGGLAVELLGDIPAPPTPPATPPTETPPPKFAAIATHELITACCGESESPSDDHLLAWWAITGCESEPERWQERVVFAKHVASKIIRDHRREILAVATALHSQHFLSGREIKQLLDEVSK